MLHTMYQKNINALKNVDIVLATKIIQASRGDSFELSIVSEKHQLYNIVDLLQERPIYSNIIDELQEHLQELHHKNKDPFIYLFGIANAYALPILLGNEIHQRIVVIEPELELLFVSFHLYDLSEDISKGRLRLFHQKSFNFAQAVSLFRENNAHHFARTFNLINTAAYYTEHFQKEIEQTLSMLLSALSYDISSMAKDFTSTLQLLDQHLENLPQMFEQTSLQSLIQVNKTGGWAVIISDLPSKAELKQLKSLRQHVTIMATQEVLEKLYGHKIIPDIVTAIHYEEIFWKTLPKEVQETMILLLPSQKDHLNLDSCYATKIISTLDSYYYRYFDLKSFGYLKEHHQAAHMAYELSFLLKYSHTLIFDKILQESETQAYKHYCYLSALYKESMNSYHLLKEKPKHLYAKQETLSHLSAEILKQTPVKKVHLLHPDKEEIVRSTKARQGIKISHLISEGYILVQDIQQSLTEIKPWYDALEGLSEQELIMHYTDTELSTQLNKLTSIKMGIERSHIYQRFFYDFMHTSMLSLHIEQADIKSRNITCSDDNKERALHWSINNYQWLVELQKNMPQTIELLLKHQNKVANKISQVYT